MQNIENVQKLCNHPHILPGGGGELMWSLEQDSKKTRKTFFLSTIGPSSRTF